MKKAVFCAVIAAAVGLHTAVLADMQVRFDDEGTVIYSGEDKTDGSSVYVGLFDRGGVLRDIRKNRSEVWFEVSDNVGYTVKLFNWNGMDPLGEVSTFKQQSDTYVISEVKAEEDNSAVSMDGGRLSFADGEASALHDTVSLADSSAAENARTVYKYLEAVGKRGSVLFGQQNNLHHKAGSGKLSNSDTVDLVGDYAAVFGIDTLSITGDDGYYTPYVKQITEDGDLYGHEMMDNFIMFYNDKHSIFAGDQKKVLSR